MHSTVTFTGNTFNGVAGTYVPGDDNDVPLILNLSDVNGTVSGNTFSNVDIGVLVGNGTGPLTISGNTFEHMHREPGTTGGGFAAGIVFFTPAPTSGRSTITDNTFTDADAGIRVSGTPGATIEGLPITIDGNDFTDVDHPAYQPAAGVLHLTNSTVDGASVPSEFVAGSSNDTIANTAANDVISGDGGTDTVTYTGTLTTANITTVADGDPTLAGSQAGWQVSAGAQGTDLLTGVEKVSDGAGHNFLLVGNGGYATIQAAINAAASGDTIMIAAGTYNENLTINTAGLTLVGVGEVTCRDASQRQRQFHRQRSPTSWRRRLLKPERRQRQRRHHQCRQHHAAEHQHLRIPAGSASATASTTPRCRTSTSPASSPASARAPRPTSATCTSTAARSRTASSACSLPRPPRPALPATGWPMASPSTAPTSATC